MLIFRSPEAFAEAGLPPVHGAKFFQHTALRVVEALHNRGQNMRGVAQGGYFGGQSLQCRCDVGLIDNRLASLVAQRGTSFRNYAGYRERLANCQRTEGNGRASDWGDVDTRIESAHDDIKC